MKTYSIKIPLCVLALGFGWAVSSPIQAALVREWDLNPHDLNQSVGSASHTFTEYGFSITAYGFDNVAGPDTAHTLYYKNVGEDHGLGMVGTPHNELQVNPDGSPGQYIQFDLSSILSAGFTNGQVKVSSIDPGEAFDIYGSNTLGTLGTKISLGGPYGSADNNIFVNIPDFGDYEFISIVSAAGDILPWALQMNCPIIPEIGGSTTALVLLAFFGVVMVSRAIRTRYNSQER
jgi:hypothetical protein